MQKIKPGLAAVLLTLGLLLFSPGTASGQDMVRKYAEVQEVHTTIGGSVDQPGNAVNGNPREPSTLRVGVGLLDAFYARQFIDFGELLEAGTPVTIKFSVPTSTLGVADNFSLQPYANLREETILFNTRWTADAVGDAYEGGNLLTLLGGVGTYEVTLTPTEDFEGIWVNLSSALSVAASMQVYHAYVEEEAGTPFDCIAKNEPLDVLSGVGGAGLDLAGGLTFVNDPYNVIDNHDNYAEMAVVAGAANEAYINTIFATPSESDQVVRIVLEQPGSLLDVSLLAAFTIQPYLEDDEVGSPIAGDSNLLGLRLLPGTDKYELAVPVQGSFDRVKISLGGVLGLLQNIRVYEVSRLPRVDIIDDPELTEALTACGSVDLLGAVTNYQPDYYDYAYFGAATGGEALPSSVVTSSGTYYIEATDKVTGCVSPRVAVNATVNEYPEITFSGETTYQISVGESVTLPTPSAANVSADFQWYDYNGNAITPSGAIAFPGAGVFTYYVVATSATGGCQSAATIVVVVNDDGCPAAFTREYATANSEFSTSSLLGIDLGFIENEANAVDGNIATYSTLTEALNLLGLTGETSQTIFWGSDVNAGTPVTVKLGREYGVASVIGSIFIAPVDSNGNEIGPRVSADPNLAGLVNGLNIFEHTFIPLGSSGSAISYSGVKIVMESAVNAFQAIRVYDAYYHTAGDPACTGQDAIDAYGGYETQLLNLNATTALIGVSDPGLAVDRDISTYAEMNNTVGVGVYGKLDVVFGTPSLATDSLQIILGEPGTLLDVGLLNELRIQRFLNNAPVDEEPVLLDPSLLRLKLLSSGSLSAITVPTNVPFDKVRITYGGTVSGLSALRIYDVSRIAATRHPDGEGPDNTVTLCAGETLSLDGLPTDCATSYKLYDAEYGGNEVELSSIPDLAAGEHTYWIQPVRNGCESLARGVLTLDITGPAEAPVVASENVWVGADGTATLSIQDPDEELTYNWYTEETGGTEVYTGSTYDLENITADATYYAEAVSGGDCASPTRTAVSVQLIPTPVVDPIGATLTEGETETFTASNIPDGLEAIWYDENNQQVSNLPQFETDPGLLPDEYTYTVVYRDPVTGATSAPATVPVTIEAAGGGLLPPAVDPPSAVIVEGNSQTFTATHDNADVTYVWYDESGTEIQTGGNTFTTPDNLAVGDYNYSVAVRDAGNNESAATPFSLTVEEADALLPPTVDPSAVTIKEGETHTFEATHPEDPDVDYTWYDADNNEVATTPEFTTPDDLPLGEHTYTVTVTDPDSGEESEPTEVTVTVEAPLTPPTVDPETATIEEGETQTFTATHPDDPDVNYTWYDADNNEVATTPEFITPDDLPVGEHTYTVTVTDPDTGEESGPAEATVTVTAPAVPLTAPEVTPETATIEQGEAVTYTATTDYPDGEIVWYDEGGNEIAVGEQFVAGPGLEPGNYSYNAVVRDPDTGEESDPATVTLIVTEPVIPEDCLPAYERIYASTQTSDGVNNAGGAVDGNLGTYSTIEIPSLFATNYQVLQFSGAFSPANGDQLHVRVSTDVTLSLLGSVTITAQAYDGNNPVGTPAQLSGGVLLNLLAGTNEGDIVVPVGSPDPNVSFNSVRVEVQGALLAGGDINIHEAYVNQETQTLADCNVEDILTGVTSGALGTLNGVSDAANAVDGDLGTAALLRQNVGLAGYAHLTTIYPAPSVPGDSIRLVITDQDAGLLDLGVATGLKIVAYMGNTPVHEVSVQEGLLSLKLLGGGEQYEVATAVDQPFDRVSVQLGGLASALEGINVYEIERVPGIQLEGNDPGNNMVEACQGETISLAAPGDDCTTYVWYDQRNGGTKIGEGNLEFEVPADWTAGEHVVYVQPVRYGCEEAGRIAVTINVSETPTADDIAVTGNEDPYCSGEDVLVTATADGITDAVFSWYADEDKQTPLSDAGGVTYGINNGALTVSGLTPGTYTYYVSVRAGADGCENLAGDLAAVEVIVNDGAVASDIQTADIQVCAGDIATLEASSTTVTNPVFTWYGNDDLSGTPVFTGPVFEQSDLEAGVYTYYVTVQGDGVCESSADEAVMVSIAVQHQVTAGDIDLPADLSQCVGSDVMLTAGVMPGITVTNPVYTWYLDASGTQVISDGDTDGTVTYTVNNNELTVSGLSEGVTATYYVSLDGDDVCGNAGGDLASVAVTISDDLEAPAVVSDNVEVCTGEDTVLEISSPQGSLTYNWYDAATGGTLVSTGETLELTAVTADVMYYVEAVGTGGCASLTRTGVSVTVNDFAGASDIDIAGETAICEGADVVLTPSSATVPNAVFRWYEDASGTTEITAGVDASGVLTVSGLTDGDHTFYASVEGDGYCENASGDLAAITVTVGAELSPLVVTPAEQYVVVGDTPQAFRVVDFATITGDVIWYSDAALTTEVARGEEYAPAAAAEGDYTYYVVHENGPCVSAATEVVLHVLGTPTPPDDCYIADSEEHGTTFGCVLCAVLDPTNAIDDNPDNYTRLSMPAGLGTGSIYQTLIFDHAGKAGDTVLVDIGTPVELADINLLGGITVTLYNGTTEVDQYSLDNPLLEIELLSGGDRGEVGIPASGVYDRVEIRNTAGVATLLQGVDIYGAYIRQAAPELDITDPVVLCEGEEYIIEAVAAPGTLLRWYDEGGALVYEGTEFEVPSDVAGDFTYYIEVVDEVSGCADPDRTEVNVQVNEAPAADDITVTTDNPFYCAGEDVLVTATADGITDAVFSWYADEDKQTPLADAGGVTYNINNGALTVSGLTPGTYTYYVSVRAGADGCENLAGDLAAVEVIVNDGAVASDIQTADIQVCAGDIATLEASSTTVTNPVFTWYGNDDLSGTPVFTGPVFEQSDLEAGVYTYYVTVQGDGVCESSADEAVMVSIAVQHQVTAGDIDLPADLSQCVGSDVMLTAGVMPGITVTNPVYTWYLDASGTQVISDGDTDGTVTYTVNNNELTVSGLSEGVTATYYVSLDGDDVCGNAGGDLASVAVTISDDLEAPAVVSDNVEVCTGEDTVLEISSPQGSLTYNWYDAATGGTLVSTGETLELTAVTADVMYYVEAVGTGGCASLTRTGVSVTVNDFAGASDIDIAGETAICEGADVVLTPSSATVPNAVFRWYEDASGTTEITAGVDASGVLTVSGLTDGDHTFYASVEGDGYCENASGDLAAITVTVGAELSPLVVTPAEQYVVVGDTPQAFRVVDFATITGDVIWYSDAALTTEVARGEEYAPAAAAEGDYTYYVVHENGPCVSAATEVVLHVLGTPTPPDDCYIADSEEHGTTFGCVLCAVLDPTNAIDDNPDNYTRLSMPAGLGTGSIYQTLIFDHAGKAGDTVLVDIGTPVELADINLLGGITVTLYNGTTEVDQYSLDNPLLEIELLSGGDRGEVGIPASGVYDRVEIRNTAGVATLLQGVDIYGAYIRQAAPELDITDPVVLCEGEEYIIEAVAAPGTLLRWYDEGGALVYEGTEFEVPSDVAGDFTYYIEVVDEVSGCADPDRTEVNVQVNEAPTADDITVTGNENPYCGDEDVVLTPSSSEGTVFRWYLDADKMTPVADGDTDGNITYAIDAEGVLTVSGLENANSPYTYYVSVEGGSGCENPAGDLAEVSVEISPNVPGDDIADIEVSGINDDGTLCVDASGNATLTASLTAGSTVTNPVYYWYDADGAVAGGEDGTLELSGLTPG
ncbi:Ig-like domain-containing protein, partial [Sinomicrobium soli]